MSHPCHHDLRREASESVFFVVTVRCWSCFLFNAAGEALVIQWTMRPGMWSPATMPTTLWRARTSSCRLPRMSPPLMCCG